MDAIIGGIQESQTSSYIIVAPVALAVYDILLKFGDEVEYIWRAKWSWPKALYLVVRYYGLISVVVYYLTWGLVHTSQAWCWFLNIFTILVGGGNANLLPVDIILYLRLSALYEHNKRVMYPILGLIILGALTELVALLRILFYKGETFLFLPPGIQIFGCTPNINRSLIIPTLIVANVATVTVSSTLFLALMAKIIKETRHRHNIGLTSTLSTMPPLLRACLRDGVIYFFAVAAVVVIALIQLYIQRHGPLGIAYVPWVIVTASVAGSRLVLDLRHAAHKSAVGGATDILLSGLNFQSGEVETKISQLQTRSLPERQEEATSRWDSSEVIDISASRVNDIERGRE